jgi:long-chain fatty acid transport protein
MPKLLSGLLLAGSTFNGIAGGFRSPDADAFATGRGEAFVATADNPSAIYYNPAGITQLKGINLRAGLYGIYLDPEFQPLPPNDTTFANNDTLHALPQLYFTYNQEDSPVTFGAGVFSPYGLGLRWPQDTGFRTVAVESSLAYITLNPVIAIKALPNLSVGAGVTFNFAQADFQQGYVWPTEALDNFRFKGSGWDVGYNLGMLWQPYEQLSLGVSFRSQTTVNLEGFTQVYNTTTFPPAGPAGMAFPMQQMAASADFYFPLIAIFGVSYRPTPKWNFEFDADYADWSVVQTVNIKQVGGAAIPFVLNWQPSWYYEFGATRYLDNGWHISAGYIFNQNSVPDAHYTPFVADQDKHFFSAGVGRTGKRWDFDIAYQFGYGPTRTVTGSAPSAIGQTADGRYTFYSHAVSASVGLHL